MSGNRWTSMIRNPSERDSWIRKHVKNSKRKELILPPISIKDGTGINNVESTDVDLDSNMSGFEIQTKHHLRSANDVAVDAERRRRRYKCNVPVWFSGRADDMIIMKHKYGAYEVTEKGLYNNKLNDWFKLVTRENSVLFPPLLVTKKNVENIKCHGENLTEKMYVMKDFFKEGKMSKFVRDEIHLPNVYTNYFGCNDCRRQYISDKYTDVFKERNSRQSPCVSKRINTRSQYCDVLGKRFCSECGEIENRKFSRSIEDDMSENLTSQYEFGGKQNGKKKKKRKKVSIVINTGGYN